MASAVLGKVSPTPKGEYVSTQDYDRLDVVTYEGYPYLAKSNVPSGNLPTDELYWMPLLTGLDFAPGGYGLGEAGGKTTTDYNTCILGGVYNGNNAVNGPAFIANAPYANVVVSRGATRIYQTMYCLGKIAHRHSNNGGSTWEEWVDWSPSAFAPSGYGLGTTGAYCADANNANKSGWYGVDTNTTNIPSGAAGTMFVKTLSTENGTDIYQTVTSGVTAIRRYYSSWAGAWQPWEYENPPMQLGVEYRTTERYDGHPVYIKTMDCGKGTADGAMNSYPNVGSNCVYVDMSCRALNTSSGWGFMLTDKLTFATAAAGHSTVSLNAGRDLTAQNIYLTVKYYKV